MPYDFSRYAHFRQAPPWRVHVDATVPVSHTGYKGKKFAKKGNLARINKKSGRIQSFLVPWRNLTSKMKGGTRSGRIRSR
jgi:hypothetical protein